MLRGFSMTVATSFALLLSAVIPSNAFESSSLGEAPASDSSDDLKLMQGKWERKASQGLRYVQVIEGNQSTMDIYQGNSLVLKRTSTFELIKEGSVKIIQWKLGKILVGPSAGQPFEDGRLAYRLEPNRLIKVRGILIDDEAPVELEVFNRIEDAKN